MNDLDNMTMLGVIDYIEEYISHQPGTKEKPKVKQATQADIDRL